MGACNGQIPISCVPPTIMVTATIVRACRFIKKSFFWRPQRDRFEVLHLMVLKSQPSGDRRQVRPDFDGKEQETEYFQIFIKYVYHSRPCAWWLKVILSKRALRVVILLLFFCYLQVSAEIDNPFNGLLTKIGLARRQQAARGVNRCFAAFF